MARVHVGPSEGATLLVRVIDSQILLQFGTLGNHYTSGSLGPSVNKQFFVYLVEIAIFSIAGERIRDNN